MALITAAEARALIPGLTDSSEDTFLDTLIARCGVAFARFCGYPGASPSMEQVTYTRYSGDGIVHVVDGRELQLGVYPVITLTTIHDDTDEEYDAASLIASSDYVQRGEYSERVLLKRTASHSWSRGDWAVRAIWDAGYATVPDDLKQLCAMGVKNWYDLQERQGAKSLKAGDLAISMTDEMFLPDIVKIGLAGGFQLPGCFL